MEISEASSSSAVPEGAYEVDEEEQIANELLRRLGAGYDSGEEYAEENGHLHAIEKDKFHQGNDGEDVQEAADGLEAADVLLSAGGSVPAVVVEPMIPDQPWRERLRSWRSVALDGPKHLFLAQWGPDNVNIH